MGNALGWSIVLVTLLSWGWMFHHVEPAAQLWLLGVASIMLLLHVVLAPVWRKRLFAAVLPLLLIPAGITAAWQVVIHIFPPRTPDGYPVMPIGQALIGLPVGALTGLGLSLIYLLYERPGRIVDRSCLISVAALFAVLLLANIL